MIRPQANAGIKLPIKLVTSQKMRQARWSTCARNSKATPRPISASRIRVNSGYSPVSSAPYHSGKVAKIAPAARTTHTSLPPQTGPMVLISALRSRSVLAMKGRRRSTPKSKPSRKK